MKIKIVIDGEHGATGMHLKGLLEKRRDLEILEIPEENKKDPKTKQPLLNEAEIVFLCLPDEAAREAVALIKNPYTKIIDASTAHRTNLEWIYGFPELAWQREKIKRAKRVSVPGCDATGFIACLHPLIKDGHGIVSPDHPIVSWAISGYSGGGKKMIGEFESGYYGKGFVACRPKNLDLTHKHLPEMKLYSGLSREPLFAPIVGNFYQGMLVFVALNGFSCDFSPCEIRDALREYYRGEKFIEIASEEEIEKIGPEFLSPTECNMTNNLKIFVFGNKKNVILVTRLDNLGKGSAGAAVQNMNIMLGLPDDYR